MGFYDVLELSGVYLHGTLGLLVGEAICDLPMAVDSPDLLLVYNSAAWMIDMGDTLPVDVASPALLLAYDDEAMNLVCPY